MPEGSPGSKWHDHLHHGEYAEVTGQIILLLPFDADAKPRVEAVSIPNAAIDRAATDEALESAKAARYAVSRGPGDFAAFGQMISDRLETVPSQSDAQNRVRLVEDIVRQLAEWPAAHHGYRAGEIAKP